MAGQKTTYASSSSQTHWLINSSDGGFDIPVGTKSLCNGHAQCWEKMTNYCVYLYPSEKAIIPNTFVFDPPKENQFCCSEIVIPLKIDIHTVNFIYLVAHLYLLTVIAVTLNIDIPNQSFLIPKECVGRVQHKLVQNQKRIKNTSLVSKGSSCTQSYGKQNQYTRPAYFCAWLAFTSSH